LSPDTVPSYYALRVCPRASASAWWGAARAAISSAPPAIRSLLEGRSRVEVTAADASAALAWARTVDGWDDDALPPVWVYPSDPA